MKRIALAKRLEWLENGHREDPEYNVGRLLEVANMTMVCYFAAKSRPLKQMAEYLALPVDELKTMTYIEVAKRIIMLCQNDEMKKFATEAVWILATPYIEEGRRRRKESGTV